MSSDDMHRTNALHAEDAVQRTDAVVSLGRKHASRGDSKGVAPIILFALFVILLLIALVAGLRSYASEVSSYNDSKATRLSVGFLANTVRGFDTTGFVSRGEGPEGDSLVLMQHTSAGDFEVRFYTYEGNLLQEYVSAGSEYNPPYATKLFPTDEFTFDVDGSLLTINTQAGSVDIALRSSAPLAESMVARE